MEADIKPGTWTDKDKEQVIKLLNFVASKAEFSELKVADIVDFHSLLRWAQHTLIPKIDSCIIEVRAVHEAEPPKAPKSKGKK